MLNNTLFEVDLLSLGIIISFLLVGFLIILQVLKSKYKTQISSLEEKLELQEKHNNQNLQNLISNYELKLENEIKLSENKEIQLLNEFEIKEENLKEKLTLIEDSKEKMKLEFESLANKLFEEKQKKSDTNLNTIVSGFKEQLDSFNKRVNDIYNDETKQRSSLLTEIKNLKELNNQISNDALNLTKALKGENKTQGDWGEMILSSILEQTGLREGKEYRTQDSYTNEEGRRLRPDVIVHLPSNKDIIIDSKVSLNAYLKYNEAHNENEKQIALKELLISIKAHIKGLSSKKYEDIKELGSLDFVLMFIPIEQAFLLATTNDNSLYKTAFDNNIVLVSPSTLFATLRTIENIWKVQHQNENALLIATKAGYLYDKFVAFTEELDDIGLNLKRSQKSYDNAINKLSTGKGNLIKRSQDLLELGVKAKKNLDSKKYLDE